MNINTPKDLIDKIGLQQTDRVFTVIKKGNNDKAPVTSGCLAKYGVTPTDTHGSWGMVDCEKGQELLDTGEYVLGFAAPKGYLVIDFDNPSKEDITRDDFITSINGYVGDLGNELGFQWTSNTGFHALVKTKIITSSSTNVMSNCGISFDFRGQGKSHVVLPFGNEGRYFIDGNIPNYDDMLWLQPYKNIKTDTKQQLKTAVVNLMTGLEGSGRNENLFKLVKNGLLSYNIIQSIAELTDESVMEVAKKVTHAINDNILLDPLPMDEIESGVYAWVNTVDTPITRNTVIQNRNIIQDSSTLGFVTVNEKTYHLFKFNDKGKYLGIRYDEVVSLIVNEYKVIKRNSEINVCINNVYTELSGLRGRINNQSFTGVHGLCQVLIRLCCSVDGVVAEDSLLKSTFVDSMCDSITDLMNGSGSDMIPEFTDRTCVNIEGQSRPIISNYNKNKCYLNEKDIHLLAMYDRVVNLIRYTDYYNGLNDDFESIFATEEELKEAHLFNRVPFLSECLDKNHPGFVENIQDTQFWKCNKMFAKQENDDIMMFSQFIAQSMVAFSRNSLFLIGRPSAGKSKYLNFAQSFVDVTHHSTIKFSDMGSRFFGIQLKNRTMMIQDDTSEDGFKDIGMVKSIISGDPVQIEVKYGGTFELIPYSTGIFVFNTMPKSFGDKVNAMGKRIRHIEYNVQYVPNDEEKKIMESMYQSQDELFPHLLPLILPQLDNHDGIQHSNKSNITSMERFESEMPITSLLEQYFEALPKSAINLSDSDKVRISKEPDLIPEKIFNMLCIDILKAEGVDKNKYFMRDIVSMKRMLTNFVIDDISKFTMNASETYFTKSKYVNIRFKKEALDDKTLMFKLSSAGMDGENKGVKAYNEYKDNWYRKFSTVNGGIAKFEETCDDII